MKKIKKNNNNKSNKRKAKKKSKLAKDRRRNNRKQLQNKNQGKKLNFQKGNIAFSNKLAKNKEGRNKKYLNDRNKSQEKKANSQRVNTPFHSKIVDNIKVKKSSLFILSIGILLLIYGGVNIIFWFVDNHNIKTQQKNLNVSVQKISASDSEEEINPPDQEEKDNKDNDYFNYMKLPFISVDFNELKNKNSDTAAFIKVTGTNINYPVVQTDNNEYYLNHSYNKKKNNAGWVFLDYRNNIDELQHNTIIYAHGRQDTTMFGSLKNTLKEDWFNNPDNHIVYISTPTYNTIWQVFSVYKIPTETYYLTSSFGSVESHQNFINEITKRSKFNFNTTVNTNDKILTLSTCYNKTDKAVLHAKLIKRVKR